MHCFTTTDFLWPIHLTLISRTDTSRKNTFDWSRWALSTCHIIVHVFFYCLFIGTCYLSHVYFKCFYCFGFFSQVLFSRVDSESAEEAENAMIRRCVLRGRQLGANISCTRYFSLRRCLGPLIKKMHPDMFVQQNDEVRRVNLVCLQVMNEMLDSIELIQTQCTQRNKGNVSTPLHTVDMRSPLSAQYSLNCYFHQKPGTGKSTVRLVRVVMMTPLELIRRQLVPIAVIKQSIHAFLVQLAPLHDCAGLSNPFTDEVPIKDNNIRECAPVNINGTVMDDWTANHIAILQQQVDVRAFEASIRRLNHMQTASVFDTSRSLAMHAQRRERKLQWRRINEEVDVFVSSGGVLMSGDITLAEEFDAVQRLRKFLQDFGADVRFDRCSWSRVVVVVVRSSPGIAGQGCNNEFNVIRCMQENDKYLLLVPYSVLKNDKVSTLLEAIRFHLPMASLSNRFYD